MKSRNDLWRVSVSGSPFHKTTLSSSPTQLLVGQLTRLPFHSGYATEFFQLPRSMIQQKYDLPLFLDKLHTATKAPPRPTHCQPPTIICITQHPSDFSHEVGLSLGSLRTKSLSEYSHYKKISKTLACTL